MGLVAGDFLLEGFKLNKSLQQHKKEAEVVGAVEMPKLFGQTKGFRRNYENLFDGNLMALAVIEHTTYLLNLIDALRSVKVNISYFLIGRFQTRNFLL